MQHTILCRHPVVPRAGWRQRYLQPLKNVFCSFNSSPWGGCGGLYHVSFSCCWIKNSTLSHLLQAVRQSPAMLSTHPTTRSGPAYPRPPSQKGLLTSNSSFAWVGSAVLIKSLFLLQHMLSAGWQITFFDPKIHWNGWEFFCCLPGTLGQGCWVWDVHLGMGRLALDECRATREHALQGALTLPIFSGNTSMTFMRREKSVTREPKMQWFRTFFSSPSTLTWRPKILSLPQGHAKWTTGNNLW